MKDLIPHLFLILVLSKILLFKVKTETFSVTLFLILTFKQIWRVLTTFYHF